MIEGGQGVAAAPHSPAPVVAGSVGILGGSFDPIHLGHLAIAEEVREALGLERVLFVPAGIPPHKPGVRLAPAEARARMVALAIAGNAAFVLSRIELDRPGPSYTVDTVEAVAAELRVRPTLILSAEALAGLPTWHEPERLLAACRLAVVPRAGSATLDAAWLAARFPGVAADAVFLDGPALAISASAIRARVAAGRSIRYLVPDAVAAHIADHGLYTERRTHRP